MSEQYANAAQTTLKEAVNKSATTLELEALEAAGFPTTAPYRLLCGSELMKVTAVNAGAKTVTVTRAAESFAGASTAEEHPKGATVTLVYSAAALLADKAEVLSPYRLLYQTSGRGSVSGASGKKYIAATNSSDSETLAVGASVIDSFHLLAEKSAPAVSGCTPKLLLDVVLQCATAPNVEITVGLYPVNAGATISLGTVVAGSTVLFNKPAINTLSAEASADFALPADGIYAVGYILSGTPLGAFTLQAAVRTHYVSP